MIKLSKGNNLYHIQEEPQNWISDSTTLWTALIYE
jgi:hypothetical protein